jgi:hypothetical protein
MRKAVAIGLSGVLTAFAGASERFASGPERVTLIELYTSEGCSSCPPADKWLGELKGKPGLWTEFVPLEFHVNYWDSLGWKDQLSSNDFTARQYAYAASWGADPYTPCFARNGVQWRPSWGTPAGLGAPMGILSVDLGDDGNCRVEFSPRAAAKPDIMGGYDIHVAILGGGISSKVTEGENGGKTLRHEFVVLGVTNQRLLTVGNSLVQKAMVPLPSLLKVGSPRHSLAAWITRHGELEPLQATGGWLP